MGAKQVKDNTVERIEDELDIEEIEFLMQNTHFNEEEIKQWFSGFMVIFLVIINIIFMFCFFS
jgi:hypothetical protein